MSDSHTYVARLQAGSLQTVATLIDRGLRLNRGAVRNAAQAASADLVKARARAEVAAALSAPATPRRELTLCGA